MLARDSGMERSDLASLSPRLSPVAKVEEGLQVVVYDGHLVADAQEEDDEADGVDGKRRHGDPAEAERGISKADAA